MSARPIAPVEPASIIPASSTPRTVVLVEANAMLGAIVLHFAAGAHGRASNIKSEIALDPADAERLALQILADLADFPARITAVGVALAGAR